MTAADSATPAAPNSPAYSVPKVKPCAKEPTSPFINPESVKLFGFDVEFVGLDC